MFPMILALLIAVPSILLAATLILIVHGSRRLKNYSECTGVIEGFHGSKTFLDEAGTKNFSPVISYTVNGEKHEFIGNYASTLMKSGQKISILYDPEDPSRATIKQGLYVGPVITGALTLFFTLALILFVILKSKGLISF